MSRKQVSKEDFILAVIQKDEKGLFVNPNCEAIGVALKEKAGEVLKPQSVYNRLQKLRKEGVNLPTVSMHPPAQKASVEDLNKLIAEAAK